MGKVLAMARPEAFPAFMQQLCLLITSNGPDYCVPEYSANPGRGLENAQVFQRLMYETGDIDYFCANRLGVSACSYPTPIDINPADWFSSPKPANASAPTASGHTFKVLHFSDWHYDPRYAVGSEANCTSAAPCCRANNWNSESPTTPLEPASRFGDYACDAPADIALSAFTSIRSTLNLSEVALAIFTGDMVSHDSHWELSDAYTEYTEIMSYLTFKAQLGDVPLFVALGNHDSNPTDMASPYSWLTRPTEVDDFSWNYALVSSLWGAAGWIDSSTPEFARTHYGAYSSIIQNGKLRVIVWNTDFYFWTNIFNYPNITNPDSSGTFAFIISELEAAEAAGQRAWLVGHVESGYTGGDAMPNPSALFYSIVQRFSPHVIAGIFFGHTHNDNLMVYYDSPVSGSLPIANQSNVTLSPINVGWIMPSITPLYNVNPSWRVYDIDSETFEVVNAYTYYSNISDAGPANWSEPVWEFEYSTRDAYDDGSWPANAPLNATWWQGVIDRMAKNESGLLQKYNAYTLRQSPYVTNCTSQKCIKQLTCYLQSGSSAQGLACGGTYLG